MGDAIDELYARWQQNPDAPHTRALCEALRRSNRADLVEIVGSHASRQLDVPALLSAARMYSDAGRLEDAQSVLVTAGQLAPRDGEVLRLLGEVLLHQGEAERAEKVLERAVQLGPHGASAGVLLDRARSLVATQRASDPNPLEQALEPSRAALPPARPPPVRPMGRPADGDDDVATLVRKNDEVRAALDVALRPAAPLPAAGRRPSPRAAPAVPPSALPPRGGPTFGMPTLAGLGAGVGGAAPGFDPSQPLSGQDLGLGYAPASAPVTARGVPPSSGLAAAPSVEAPELGAAPSAGVAASFAAPQVGGFGAHGAQTANVQLAGGTAEALAQPPPSAPFMRPHRPFGRPPEPAPPASANRYPAAATDWAAPPARFESPRFEPDGKPVVPEPRDILQALAIAGVFEPEGAVRPLSWDKPTTLGRRLRSTIGLAVLAVSLVLTGFGTHRYVTRQRARQHVEAEALLANVDADLDASDERLLEPIEKDLGRAFDLESRSPHAALTWLRERAMVGLLRGGESVAFAEATERAKEMGVPEAKVAFAYVASFLFQGDTGGAAATVAKWDEAARGDGWYQVLAGATFERAGDPRALERYASAQRLAPELVVARLRLARALAMEGDVQNAGVVARDLRGKLGARPEAAAIAALAWARDPLRTEPPAEVRQVAEAPALLPVFLKLVPDATRAVLALDRRAPEEAKPALQRGLALVDTPSAAAWLGSIALATGDETLARRAALSAVSLSAAYAPARVLAARVALLGGRVDEALKAAEDLPATSPDVAVVTAAVAYEKLDDERMARALDAVPEASKGLPFMAPLLSGQGLLGGRPLRLPADKQLEMATDEAPWADLVAMDAALDTGDLDLADRIAERWKAAPRPLRTLRLARLARYRGKHEDADRMSRAVLESGSITARALTERVLALSGAGKTTEALAIFKSQPSAGGPVGKWLHAYVLATAGKTEDARTLIAQEEPPPGAASIPARAIAAMALGATKDARRGSELVRGLVQAGFANPDVAAAAERLGSGRAGHHGR